MMPRIEKILFATALTEDSRHAFRYASSVAARFGASIVLLHVIEQLPAGVQQRLDLLAGQGAVEGLRRAGERRVRDVLIGKRAEYNAVNQALAAFYGDDEEGNRAFHEVCEIVVVEGRPPEEVVKAAEEHRCDLVVLGAHKGWLRGAAVGGVAKRVLQHGRLPVLVVPPSADR